VVFETSLSYDRLNFFCFNNIFRVIAAEFPKDGNREGRPSQESRLSQESLENFVRNAIRRKAGRGVAADLDRGDSSQGPAEGFRVIFSLENSPTALSEGLRGEAESYISSLTGLRVNRARPGVEFWFLLRREGAFFMRRLSRHRPWDKLLHPGELPPPLAWMLCRLSNPRPGEKAADPFCGYGSIPAARLRHFPPAEFFASDIDRAALRIAKGKFRGKPQHCCHFNRLDVEELPRIIPPAGLDSIITDPPWGCYQKPGSGADAAEGRAGRGARGEQETPAVELYERSLAVFSGLLKPGGSLVMLCSRGEELKAAAEKNSFTITRNIPILLSGRKAAIFILRPPR
jgi:23S rRNA G2445 N2-methylase RlmL